MDMHVCPAVEPGPVPHVGGPIIEGSSNVFIDFRPAARKGDAALCTPVGKKDKITGGSKAVLINGKAAARLGDGNSHGGSISGGSGGVMIGDTGDIAVSPDSAGTQDIYGKVLLGCGCPSPAQADTIIAARGAGRGFCAVCSCS
jgi:uncharacterized Zn-binding protein involved in type VI secretion